MVGLVGAAAVSRWDALGRWLAPAAPVFALLLLVGGLSLRQIARRPRFGGSAELAAADDWLHRRAGQR